MCSCQSLISTLRLTIKVKNKQNHLLKHPVLACAGLHVNFRQDSFCLIFTLVALANGRCSFSFSIRTVENQSHISTFLVEKTQFLNKDVMRLMFLLLCDGQGRGEEDRS